MTIAKTQFAEGTRFIWPPSLFSGQEANGRGGLHIVEYVSKTEANHFRGVLGVRKWNEKEKKMKVSDLIVGDYFVFIRDINDSLQNPGRKCVLYHLSGKSTAADNTTYVKITEPVNPSCPPALFVSIENDSFIKSDVIKIR